MCKTTQIKRLFGKRLLLGLLPLLFSLFFVSQQVSAVVSNSSTGGYYRYNVTTGGYNGYSSISSFPFTIPAHANDELLRISVWYNFVNLNLSAGSYRIIFQYELDVQYQMVNFQGSVAHFCGRNIRSVASSFVDTDVDRITVTCLDSFSYQANAANGFTGVEVNGTGLSNTTFTTLQPTFTLVDTGSYYRLIGTQTMTLSTDSGTINSINLRAGTGNSPLYEAMGQYYGGTIRSLLAASISPSVINDENQAIVDGLDELASLNRQTNDLLSQQNNLQQENNNAINEGNQQEQDRYDADKQEESDREQAGSDSSQEALGLFNFTVLNPFSGIDVSDGCVTVPTLGSWLHLANSQVCPFFPDGVRAAVSPVIGIFVFFLTFGFLWRLLGTDQTNLEHI